MNASSDIEAPGPADGVTAGASAVVRVDVNEVQAGADTIVHYVYQEEDGVPSRSVH